MEQNGDIFRRYIINYWYEIGTKFDDCGTKCDELGTKYNPERIKYRPLEDGDQMQSHPPCTSRRKAMKGAATMRAN